MSNFVNDLVDAIKASVPVQRFKPESGEVFDRQLYHAPEQAKVEPLKGSTLTGLLDFIESTVQKNWFTKPNHQFDFIYVTSPKTVSVVGPPRGMENKRDKYFLAIFPLDGVKLFDSKESYSLSSALDSLHSQFAELGDWEELVKFLSNISIKDTTEHVDNGVCSNVVVKSGIASLGEVKVPKIVNLAPFQTFTEIEPVLVPHKLRIRKKYDKELIVEFLEADGGASKKHIMEKIKLYLIKELGERGLNEIPVLC